MLKFKQESSEFWEAEGSDKRKMGRNSSPLGIWGIFIKETKDDAPEGIMLPVTKEKL